MSFGRMLMELIARVPAARGAIFCDWEGESVGLALADPPPPGAPALSEYDLKVAGAQVAAAWMQLQQGGETQGAGPTHELDLRCPDGRILCRAVRGGYYVVMILGPGARSGAAAFALRETAREVESDI